MRIFQPTRVHKMDQPCCETVVEVASPKAINAANRKMSGSSVDMTEIKSETFSGRMTTERRPEPPRALLARSLVDSKYFVATTMVLTIWALTGDDLRLILTQKPADNVFNAVVICSIVIFSLEICLSWVGKSDYPFSFFMILDVIATGTMLLDITWVADGSLWGGDSEDNTSSLRGGRSAKVGAKVARIVRVVRLVRIVKLYKAYHDARMERLRQKERLHREREGLAPGEFDDWDENDLQDDQVRRESEESQIGKKLSDMTTRMLIVLILAMLVVLPILSQEEATKMPFSADYGADAVWQAFQAYDAGEIERVRYEESLLKYVYYHNWFAYEEQQPTEFDGPINSYSHLFWVGVVGKDAGDVARKAANATVRSSTLEAWTSTVRRNAMYAYGTMPQPAQDIIVGTWSTPCDSQTFHSRGFSLLSHEIQGVVGHTVQCPSELRYMEWLKFTPQLQAESQWEQYHLVFYFDNRPFVRQESRLGLLTTFFVVILLIAGSIWFSNGANHLLVQPLELMMMRVKEIRENPMAAMRISDDEFKEEQRKKARQHFSRKDRVQAFLDDISSWFCSRSTKELMETVILEKTIIKLGGLLVLGFGEAGANIISHNMQGGNTVGVNAMVPGVNVECIIGIARISNFSIATEVLESKIMTFVNHIAEIVHGVASSYHAAPNRNSGDVFLLVWRIDEERSSVSRMAEMSLVAFAKMLAALHRSPVLETYRHHPGLQNRLGDNCQVNMTFGLHAGWAIEGAVGSEFKIDASYVSPHVSLAYSVESATRAYGVSFVASHSVMRRCRPAMLAKGRLIDHVQMAGSKEPVELYCVDLDYKNLQVHAERPLDIVWNTRNRFKARKFLEDEKRSKLGPDYDPAHTFDSDRAICAMRKQYKVEFFQLFNSGYQNYKEGEWQVAEQMLRGTRACIGRDDGPSVALLRFMAKHDPPFEAPKGWKGIREFPTSFVD